MSKIALFTDTQARGSDLAAFYRQWSAGLAECRRRAVDAIFHAGDVYDNPMIGDRAATTEDILAAVVWPIAAHVREIPFYALPGNHDLAGDNGRNALTSLSLLANARVIRHPQVVKLDLDSGLLIIVALPWSWNADNRTAEEQAQRLVAQLAGLGPEVAAPTLFLAHVEVTGARMNSGKTCEGGKWCLSRSYLESLPVDRVALGHFHGRAPDLAGPGRGGYVGALRQCDHNGEGDPQGFEIWDTETNAVEWIELSEIKPHRTVVIAKDEPLPEPEENLRVVTQGWLMGAADAQRFQDAGGKIKPDLEREARVQRATVEADQLANPFALLDLWASTQSGLPVPKELLESELRDELGKIERETVEEEKADEGEELFPVEAF